MYSKRIPLFIKSFLSILCLFTLLLMFSPQQSDAFTPTGLTLTVTKKDDATDINPGDGICHSLVGCTLRAAIQEINAYNVSNPGSHAIDFNISGTPKIVPAYSLPGIDAPITIDGTSLSGSTCPSGVNTPAALNLVLDGFNAGVDADGFSFATGSDGSLVKGLVIKNFDGAGIDIRSGVDDITIQCNHIGVTKAGDTAAPNDSGISSGGSSNGITIGGPFYEQRNVISGNEQFGIYLAGIGNDDVIVKGNFIGTDATGTTAILNQSMGINIHGANAAIGGFGATERNIISGNEGTGIYISQWSDEWTIQNNYIGTDVFGTSPLGNGDHGINITKGFTPNMPNGHIIGVSGQENIIAYNGRAGIFIYGDSTTDANNPFDNTMRYNSIFGNGDLGIDLSFAFYGDGGTPNDGVNDPDDGPNTLLNFPELSDAYTDGVDVTVTLDYAGAPGTYVTDLYINDSCDPSGYGEGQTFVHTYSFFTGNGTHNNTISFAASGVAGKYVTSTVTYSDNTSEFSNCIPIADVTSFVINDDGEDGDYSDDGRCDTDNNAGNGDQCTLRAAIEQVNALGGSVGPITVDFDIPGSGPHYIELGSALPTITHPILLDATTQSGAKCAGDETSPAQIAIVLNGGGTTADGITLGSGSDGSWIRGFSFFKFGGDAIQIDSDDNVVQCNHIGTDYTGTGSGIISGNGIHISGDNNLIGGTFGSLRNVISANGGHGLLLDTSAELNDIFGNIVGLEANAIDPLGNGGSGIYINGGDRNNVGGISEELGNVISTNTVAGVFLNLDSDYNDLINNKIGTDLEGNPNRGNGAQGIYGERSDYNNIGTSLAGGVGNLVADNDTYGIRFINNSTGNWIRFNNVIENGNVAISIANSDDQRITHNKLKNNSGAGIAIADGGGNSTGNEISENSIYNNSGLGIDLEGDGNVEPNDVLDPDGGPNLRQNYPVISSATEGTYVNGELNSLANRTFKIEFFSTPSCDNSGYGEGKTFLGDTEVTTDGSGHVDFTAAMPNNYPAGEFMTAVATDIISKNSSEFSACFELCGYSSDTEPTISIVNNSIQLDWTLEPTALHYIIYRSTNQPYNLLPSFYTSTIHPNDMWSDPDLNAVGDVDNNYYYAMAVDRACGTSGLGKTIGEFDFAIVPGTP